MKRYEFTIYTYLMTLLFIGISLFSSCSDEVAVDAGNKTDSLPSLSIVANVETGIVTRATDSPTTDENNNKGSWIKNLTVFFFAIDAADGDVPLLTKNVEVPTPSKTIQANQIALAGQDLRKAGIELGSHVAVYAIANQTIANASTRTKKQVMDMTATLPEYNSGGKPWGNAVVPMSGKIADYEIKSEINQTISLEMKRAVIKIALSITDAEKTELTSWKITSIKFYNDYADTYLWNEGIPATPGYRTEDAGIGKTPTGYITAKTYDAGTFYLNCNETSTVHSVSEPIKIKVSGLRVNESSIETPFEYTVDLKRADGTHTHIFERNTNLTATLTLRAGSVDLKIEGIPWDEEIITNEGETLMKPEPKANCYIVKPKSAILIPVSQVQDVHNFNADYAADISPDEVLTAILTWTESGRGLDDYASIQKIEVLGTGPDALLLVIAGEEIGSNVVSVFSGETFKWSWHIWVTDYDPETTNITTTNGAYTFMDRHLGARTNEPDPNGNNANGVVGAYYQWGRPTPLPTKSFTATGEKSDPLTVYDADRNVVSRTLIALPTSEDIKQIGNPLIYYGSAYNLDQAQLWNDTKKTSLDPCPAGWRVPSKKIWEDNVVFNTAETSGVQSNAGFFPVSHGFMEIDKIYGYRRAFFWTSTRTGKVGEAFSYNYKDSSATAGGFANLRCHYGVPVRCVKENN